MTASSSTRPKAFAVAIFLVCLALNLGYSVVGWWHNLREVHEFRQTQTALAARALLQDGWQVAGPMPLFGPPWSAPMEFPLYQSCVARLAAVLPLPLEPVGRAVSLAFFYLALPAFYLLLGRLALTPPRRWLFLALVVVTPAYLYYSRAFMIESTALCAAAWFLHAFCRTLETARLRWLFTAFALGALAALTKVTTFAVFLFPAIAFTLARLWQARPSTSTAHAVGRWRPALHVAALALGVALPALAVGYAWVSYGDAVKEANPLTRFLVSSRLHEWNYGPLALRFEARFWRALSEHSTASILPAAALALILVTALVVRGALLIRVAALLGCYLAGPLLFGNLYFLHDYYFYATGVFLLAAFSVGCEPLFDRTPLRTTLGWLVFLAVLAAQVHAFHRSYYQVQKRPDFAYPELAATLRASTAPDDILLIYGFSWDPAIPYVADRKAVMVIEQYARDTAALDEVLARMPPGRIGAFVITGSLRFDRPFIDQLVKKLALHPQPLLQDDTAAVYYAGRLLPFAVPRLESLRLTSLKLTAPVDTEYHGTQQRRYRPADLPDPAVVAMWTPRPTEIVAPFGLGTTDVEGSPGFNAHAPTFVTVPLPPAARRLRADFGLIPAAYSGERKTDGVEFEITLIDPLGRTGVLFHRFLNPATVPADRGRQHLDFDLPPGATGRLVFRTLPGPYDSIAFDWAWWTAVEVK